MAILSLVGREKVGELNYGDVWDKNFIMRFDIEACKNCEKCNVIGLCPTEAFIIKDRLISAIDRFRCFNCGRCAHICPDAFTLDLKSVIFEGREIPIVLRQSDRGGAILLAEELKSKILKGEFPLEKPTGKLDFAKIVK